MDIKNYKAKEKHIEFQSDRTEIKLGCKILN